MLPFLQDILFKLGKNMFKNFKFILIFNLVFYKNSFGSFIDAQKIIELDNKNLYPKLVSELIEEKMYFSSVPFIKEFLAVSNGTNDVAIDRVVENLIGEVGVKQFEVLPNNLLEKSKAPVIRYIMAKKFFKNKNFEKALEYLQKPIEDWNPIKPFSLHLEASIYSILKKEDRSLRVFNECIDVSNKLIGIEKDPERLRQIKANRDYCIIGTPRSQFAIKKNEDAYLNYLELEKSSYIWPEILFEEAWNSFYLKDYNRTLGKLVTYKAPVFKAIFNPEIEVIKSLTFMELCLWDDSKKVIEDFYLNYEKNFDDFQKQLSSFGKDYKQYYLLMKENLDNKLNKNELMSKLLTAISYDLAYLELNKSFLKGRSEIEKIKSLRNEKLKMILNENLKESLGLQRNLIGKYIKEQLNYFSNQMTKSFGDLSYIKLEILSKMKNEIYENVNFDINDKNRKRGSLIYLKRTNKQYFWNFNGEFWADELGDYVFSLKSECN